MTTKDFPVFDCDSHVVEPPEIWDEYVPAGIRPCVTKQGFEPATEGRRRVARRGYKAAAVRPCLWNGRYPTLAEFDPLWREFEDLGVVLAMHTFPSREALTPEWAQRIAQTRGSGNGLLFTDEAVVYSPGQFVSNIVFAMEPTIDASEALGFIMEAMTWLTTVLMTGWLEKFPRLKCTVLESNATWLPMVLGRSRNFLDLLAFQRGEARTIADPSETFYRRCFIAFESDEEPVYRMWDLYENVGIWSSDYPHHDAEDVWEALELMAKFGVPEPVQKKLLGENARRLYGIEPVLVVKERIDDFRPQILAW